MSLRKRSALIPLGQLLLTTHVGYIPCRAVAGIHALTLFLFPLSFSPSLYLMCQLFVPTSAAREVET